MAEGVRVDLGPPPFEDFDPKGLVGTTVTIERDGPADGRVLEAWMHEGRMIALITVGEVLKRALADSHELTDLTDLDVLDDDAVQRVLAENPEPKRYRVAHYGRTYSIRRVTLGGFRTRYRVQWARGIWRSIKQLWPDYLACLEGHFEQMQEEDRRRMCPHDNVSEWWAPLGDTGWVRCEACGEARPDR